MPISTPPPLTEKEKVGNENGEGVGNTIEGKERRRGGLQEGEKGRGGKSAYFSPQFYHFFPISEKCVLTHFLNGHAKKSIA